MDERQTWSRRIGLTRGKAAIVAVLAVTLVVVIYVKYGPSTTADFPVSLVARSRRGPKAVNRAAGASPQATQLLEAGAAPFLSTPLDDSRWKSPELATVLAYDPFALPPGFPQPPQGPGMAQGAQEAAIASDADAAADQMAEAIESMQMELEELQQRGVQIILRGRDQYVAMIGDRTIHVGDEISGFTVTAIEPDHVRVERKVQK